ncbi:TPA: glucosaminidase domain-containing protein [Streptococcus pyogenes]|nr:glucosaminidase domain-containing protein [Streptococcus pyogenes]HER6773183.1 glucosaminidase domain-containing protein [Streptococcus pyogenes]HER8990189.1 glucosaminidase domain-containing protein [Streptococcus pyogenes]HES1680964.1 glucosaminidase domain-containing protein [Streptococcus pyogenes]HES4044899.1 glucosaminidase domain-containing protein [Streptococcus pyogenes]
MAFLDKIKSAVIAEWHTHKILPSLTAAQAILESGWGKYAPHNALFGIKADASWTGKSFDTKTQEEYQSGIVTDIVDRFRAYDSWDESIADHGQFLVDNPRYQAVVGETDYKKACHAIKDAGYATASGYAELLIQLIEENNLQEWDAEVIRRKEKQMISSQCREVIEFYINLANAGMGVDKDGAYGTQCADVPCYAAKHWFGVDLWGNAADLLASAAALGWEVHYMPTNENPRAGAFFVMNAWFDGVNYGHTGLVYVDSDGYTMQTIEQNIDGNADALYVGGPARFNVRDFTNVAGWFYPPYQGDAVAQTVSTEPQTSDTIVETAKTGTFTLDVAEINIRRWPSLASEVVGIYKQGDTVNFDSEGYANGYYWISYVGGLGMRNYLAIGQTDKDGNRISIWGKLN